MPEVCYINPTNFSNLTCNSHLFFLIIRSINTDLELQIKMKFPSHGLVYDYSLEDGGVSRKDDDDDDERKAGEVRGKIGYLIRGGVEK